MFSNIHTVKSRKEKTFFAQNVTLFIKLIHAFSSKHQLDLLKRETSLNPSITERLIELDIFQSGSKEEDKLLHTILKKELYENFLTAIQYNLHHKEIIGNLLDNIDPSKRKKIQHNSVSDKPRIVDFFCGAGGFSLGFGYEGFQIDFANDKEEVCIETFKYNHPEIKDERVILGDIRKIVDNLEEYITNDISVVIGGPPCQGFSSANQQRLIDDPRNELYKYFIKAVTQIAPKFVVMENVRGMLPHAKQVIEDYNNIRTTKGETSYTYKVAYKILASDDFGVAQKRQRLIFIGVREDILESENITPEKIFQDIEKECQNIQKHTLKKALEFIKPLEAPRIPNQTEVDDETTGKKIDINRFTGIENTYLQLINQNRTIDFVYNHKARYVNDITYEIYKTLEQGEDSTNEKIKHVMPYSHRNHVFADKFFKLIEDQPSRTITAHLKMDCHSHIHPRQVRAITPREAARIQSFPDDYVFLGAYLKTYMQIGNAVPPLMAQVIAKIIKRHVSS